MQSKPALSRLLRNHPRLVLIGLLGIALLLYVNISIVPTNVTVIIPNSADDWHQFALNHLQTKKVNVAVFEEHHEALIYWYTAAEKGIIPKLDNTLVHIDAHSDMATPQHNDKMPYFTYPTSHKQVAAMILQNDVFILAAASTGLINRIIWIYPPWLNVSHSDTVNRGEAANMFIGSFKYSYSDTEDKQLSGFCGCYRGLFADDDENECSFLGQDGDEIEDYDKPCEPKKYLQVHYIRANDAKTYVPKILSDMGDRKPILDIDEDFFGTVQGFDWLGDIEWEIVSKLNNHIGHVFQAQNTEMEKKAHDYLVQFFRHIVLMCSENEDDERTCSRTQFGRIIMTLNKKGFDYNRASGKPIPVLALRNIMQYITEYLTGRQIKRIASVGFCLIESPRTMQLVIDGSEKYEHMMICHGRNTPDNDNQIFVPTEKETEKTALLMGDLIRLVPNTDLVTVCRSNRDGYVPRHLMPLIEKRILDSLHSVYSSNTNVILDDQLMNHLLQTRKKIF